MRIAINGFGRIGRQVFKAGFLERGFTVVAVNDLTPVDSLAYLLKYDTVYGVWDQDVKAKDDAIMVGRKKIPVFSEKDPSKLPWKELKVDVVIEATGVFKTEKDAGAHLKAGAKKVIITAPAKDDTKTIVLGVNESDAKGRTILSNASCTTNAAASVMKALESLDIQRAMLTTIHAYTASQTLVDGPEKDPRRGRAGAMNIVPTSTGAAIATSKTIPSLKDKFDGISVRVPVVSGSLVDITFVAGRETTVEEVNKLIQTASKSRALNGILAWTDEPIVSSDIIGDPHSSIVDLLMTRVVDGELVKIVAWYDNEWAYSNRLVELALKK